MTVDSRLFINLSNHPSVNWTAEQLTAAKRYGEVVDMAFPAVSPDASYDQIQDLAKQIVDSLPKGNVTLHVMGEMTLTYAIVTLCKAQGIPCVASTTERIAVVEPDGKKTSTFRFVEFRKYFING